MTITIVGYIIASVIFGTLLDILGYFLGWWPQDHQLSVLAEDINYLGQNFTTSIFGIPPAEVALSIAKKVKTWLTFSTHIGMQDWYFMRILRAVVIWFEPFWQSLVYSAMSVLVRCFIIVMSSFLFLITFFVAAVDGLVERELRKEGGGNERGKVYHYSKKWAKRIIVISPIIYLSFPEAIDPAIVILPAAGLFGLSVYMAFSTFMKFL